MVYLFFKKKKYFPKWYVGLVVVTIIFIILDSLIIQSVLQTESAFDEEILKDLWRSVLSAFIWIPYMFVSKRVKATFVN
jgi:hypothetical protein